MTQTGAIEIRQQNTKDGAILFDAARAAQAAVFNADWFERDYWRTRGLATHVSGGRGGITFVRAPEENKEGGDWVLRHYRRGGMVARVMGDRYLWSGAEQTRSFAEFRLLAELVRRGLDVPRPVAARYRRDGIHYRADLITQQIADTLTLAQCVAAQGINTTIAQRVGLAIGQLHAAGVYHADLNAHNVLLDALKVWVIDFDRGELRAPERTWQLENLLRLKRSLRKLGAAGENEAFFEHEIWLPLMTSYERSFDVAVPNQRIADVR